MGGACCKNLDPPTSPQLPVCELFRRCARQMCPLDPPAQKVVSRSRKYGLSDIVGPVSKKDSWAQTDPLPPPRRKKKDKRRRSRSVEFLPYLLRDSRRSSGSLGNIAGQEDAIDFQLFFMNRLPRNSLTSTDEGKETISGRKKEFLSGLLGEENNNLPALGNIQSVLPETFTQSNSRQEIEPGLVVETNSRKSSISESLKEFESSLLDMLQDIGEEEDEAKSVKEQENQRILPIQLKVNDLSPLKEEKEDEYILTPLEEEGEDDIWSVNNFLNNAEKNHKKKDRCKVVLLSEGNDNGYEKQNKFEENIIEIKNLNDESLHEIKLTKSEPPVIRVESVS